MSLFKNKQAPAVEYYRSKCKQHLRRTLASFELAGEALTQQSEDAVAERFPGVFDDSVTYQRDRMREVLVRSHFLLLKVEFELFLHLLALQSWRVALRRDRAGTSPLSAAAKRALVSPSPESLLEHDDVVEAISAAIVPKHGLGRIVDSMRHVGTILPQILNDHNYLIWPQLSVAFQVRHLIEHRNGHIDDSFRAHSSKLWVASSWGRRLGDLRLHAKVNVTKDDLQATADLMLDALSALEPRCLELDDLRDPQHKTSFS